MTKTNSINSKISGAVFGAILVGIGMIFLVGNILPFWGVDRLWPLFMLAPVALLAVVWFQDRERYAVVLFPITIIVFFAVYFLWLNFTTWFNVGITWPNFLIGPDLGFLVLYFAKKRWEFMIPTLILLLLAAIFYTELVENTLIAAFIFIGVGITLVAKSFLSNKKEEVPDNS